MVIDTFSRSKAFLRSDHVNSRVVTHSYRAASALAAGALALVFWTSSMTIALGQGVANRPASGDELKPLFASSADIADGEHLAQTSCSQCHGGGGVSVLGGVPSLAGQRPSYIFRELRAYASGARKDSTMYNAVKFLSSDALIKVAAYYGGLDPAPPAAAIDVKGDVDPMQAGKAAIAACAGCHGENGISKMPGAPNLVGQNPKYLVAAMTAYKGGDRKNDTMKAMIAPVADASMNAIAMYFALQNPKHPPAAAPGSAAKGQALAAACASCHGAQGNSSVPTTPSLAGQDPQYLAAALHGYKDGSRGNATMKGIAGGLDDAAITNLAAYFAGLQAQQANVQKPLTVAQLAERCDRCHGVNGNSTDVARPALAAQRLDYLLKSLNAYRSGARKSPEMAAMSGILTDDDVKNISVFYAHQKAKSVVYVTIQAEK